MTRVCLTAASVIFFLGITCIQKSAFCQDVQVPQRVLQEFEYLVGDWKMEGKIGDEPVKAEYSFAWAPGKHCLVYHMIWTDKEGTSRTTGISGWSGSENEIREIEFGSSGWNSVLKYKLISAGIWEGTGVWCGPENRETQATIKFEKKGPDYHTWTGTDWKYTKGEGDPLYNVELHFRRVKD